MKEKILMDAIKNIVDVCNEELDAPLIFQERSTYSVSRIKHIATTAIKDCEDTNDKL